MKHTAEHGAEAASDEAQYSTLLKQAGLRTTKPRLVLAALLFAAGNRHVTAETLAEEARQAGLNVSQATIYNTLNQFLAAGLLREVQVDQSRSYFDTNLSDHHHFFVEDEARLIDIDAAAVQLAELPPAPDGYRTDRVDVVIRLDRKPA